MTLLAQLRIEREADVFSARRDVVDVAAGLGYDRTDQVRVASAVSDWGRLLVSSGVAALVRFELDPGAAPALVVCIAVDQGSGFLAVAQQSEAVRTSERMMDSVGFDLQQGTVRVARRLPAGTAPTPSAVATIRRRFGARVHTSPLEDLHAQNEELLRTLEDLKTHQDDLLRVNTELQETNSGVLAMYTQLSTELEETNRGVLALYAELDERGEQLREANHAKSRFLASISHELRSPLNSIRALATLLREPDSDPLTAEQDEQLRLIQAAAGQLQGMVDELLDLAKAESGRLTVQATEVDVAGLVNDLCTSLRPITPDAVELVARIPADLPPLETDPVLLGRVLRNLLSNAVKFTEHGQVTLAVTRPDPARVAFAVADSGIGIADTDIELIFEEFFQVPGPLQVRVKGTGLGLPYARRAVAALGGELTATSTTGAGSTFGFSLPAQPGASGPQRQLIDLGTVLVVDDDQGFRHLLRAMLHGAASRVVEADSVAAAVSRLEQDPPDLVLLDLRLPDGSAGDVLRAITERPFRPPLPVVIITSMSAGQLPELPPGRPVLDKAHLTAGRLAEALAEALADARPAAAPRAGDGGPS